MLSASKSGSAASTGYNLTRSLRFRASASAYLNRTFGTPTNQAKWTWSAWVKLGLNTAGGSNFLFSGNTGSTDTTSFSLIWNQYLYMNGTSTSFRQTNAVYRDPSAWYHVVLAVDTTQSTEANKLLLWVNNVGQTYSVTNAITTCGLNASSATVNIGRYSVGASSYFDGYIAEQNFIDGQALTPSSFGSTNATTGVWQPARYAGTYGTNGFYLPFTDNSALTTSSNVGLGKDFSGNGNYWTTNNISITAGVTYDSMTDVPTLTSATASNFAVLNPLINKTNGNFGTLTNGNLTNTANSASNMTTYGSIAIDTSFPKVYWEVKNVVQSADTNYPVSGIANVADTQTGNTYWLTSGQGVGYYASGFVYNGGTLVGTFTAPNTSITMYAYDPATGKFWVGTSGTWQNSGNPAAGTGQIATLATTNSWLPVTSCATSGTQSAANFGQQPFTYTPPTGFVALNTYNLPTSTILQGNKVMDATLYTGTGASLSVTNAASFKPDLVWTKGRSIVTQNKLTDSVRGVTKAIISNSTAAETTDSQGLTAFNSNGFTVGTDTTYNSSGSTYVGWQWQAGQGSTSSNTSGTITSTVSVNASAGFSIATFTGTGANGTVGHGLGVAPSMYIVKSRSAVGDWWVYHTSLGAGKAIFLSLTDAAATGAGYWNNTAPTSSVFTVGVAGGLNATGVTQLAYCWTPIAGYSAFGSYTGNGSADGPFTYLGFRPKYVVIKRTNDISNWNIYDSARSTYNVNTIWLNANLSDVESSAAAAIDFLSNGFKNREAGGGATNASGSTYIYMAFAENPFKNSLAR